MELLNNLYSKSARAQARLIIPESIDPRVLIAAEKIKISRLANVVLIGKKKDLEKVSFDNGCNISGIDIIDPEQEDRIIFAFKLLKENRADGLVCGVETNKNKLIAQARRQFDLNSFSGFTIVINRNTDVGEDGLIFFADTSVTSYPDANELSNIALKTIDSFMKLTNMEPRIAFLSHSTKGDYADSITEKIKSVVSFLREKKPALIVDGEIQADTALLARASKKKDPEGILEGYSNILIFPDLSSADIASKLVQILGETTSIGPIIQGVPKPIGFVSRSCVSNDIVNCVAAVSSIFENTNG